MSFAYVINFKSDYILTEQKYMNSDENLKGETPKCTQMIFFRIFKILKIQIQ